MNTGRNSKQTICLCRDTGGKGTLLAQHTTFNTLDNWGHKTPTQSKRKRTEKKIKGSWSGTCIHTPGYIYITIYNLNLMQLLCVGNGKTRLMFDIVWHPSSETPVDVLSWTCWFWEKISGQTDWHAKQPSQAGHIINDLKFFWSMRHYDHRPKGKGETIGCLEEGFRKRQWLMIYLKGCERAIVGAASIGPDPKPMLGKLLRDELEQLWVFIQVFGYHL